MLIIFLLLLFNQKAYQKDKSALYSFPGLCVLCFQTLRNEPSEVLFLRRLLLSYRNILLQEHLFFLQNITYSTVFETKILEHVSSETFWQWYRVPVYLLTQHVIYIRRKWTVVNKFEDLNEVGTKKIIYLIKRSKGNGFKFQD